MCGVCVGMGTWLRHAVSQEGVHDVGAYVGPHARRLDDQRVLGGQRPQSYQRDGCVDGVG